MEPEVFDKVAENFQKAGYGDTTSLQNALVAQGNKAAEAYPDLDKIHECYLGPVAHIVAWNPDDHDPRTKSEL